MRLGFKESAVFDVRNGMHVYRADTELQDIRLD